ncbi:MAG: hypothetical protein GXP55_24650 [Deltaproteobacteria bacterium]|nr:hypothetical protein [Deltaproteobacteria bacterium]
MSGRVCVVGLWLLSATVAAQDAGQTQSERIFDDVAASLVIMMEPHWTGARVPHPPEEPRPDLPVAARSVFLPLAVHADASVPRERIEASLRALEHAYLLSQETGFGLPWPDGGRGGTGEFDLYLEPTARGAEVHADAPVAFAFLDAVSSYASVDPEVDADKLESCVAQALAEASFLSQDPAESAQWRHAYGAWLAFAQTGRFGCGDPVASQQLEPWRSYVQDGAEDGGGGALLLEGLSLPRDGGTGRFIREVVQFARQRTWEGSDLRASPDLWETIHAVIEHSSDKLPRSLRRLAADRFFLGNAERRRGATNRALLAADQGVAVPVFWRARWSQLPAHSPTMVPAIEPYGSSYAIVDVRDAAPDSILRVWLRGEYGVEWTMVTMRLDADGRELGRMSAPPRGDVPRGYLPVQLDAGTAAVVIVVLNLSRRLPDADYIDENIRTFRLIVDAEAPASAAAP